MSIIPALLPALLPASSAAELRFAVIFADQAVLQPETGVPNGIINGSSCGGNFENGTHAEMVGKNPAFESNIKESDKTILTFHLLGRIFPDALSKTGKASPPAPISHRRLAMDDIALGRNPAIHFSKNELSALVPSSICNRLKPNPKTISYHYEKPKFTSQPPAGIHIS
jgi:hypothetical protein